MSRTKRPDEDYEIESLTKGRIVLEALEGRRWEPVPIATIVERTGFSRDLVDRTLKTLRLGGYAVQVGKEWTIGKRFIRLAESVAKHRL
jgi:DNA-binding IclR family transcriptional regulator